MNINDTGRADAWDEGHRLHSPVIEFGDTPCDCRNPYRSDRTTALDFTRAHYGICPKCREEKFIGHGPLCIDCYLTPTNHEERP